VEDPFCISLSAMDCREIKEAKAVLHPSPLGQGKKQSAGDSWRRKLNFKKFPANAPGVFQKKLEYKSLPTKIV